MRQYHGDDVTRSERTVQLGPATHPDWSWSSDKSAVKHNTTTRRSGDTQDISRRQSGDRRQVLLSDTLHIYSSATVILLCCVLGHPDYVIKSDPVQPAPH